MASSLTCIPRYQEPSLNIMRSLTLIHASLNYSPYNEGWVYRIEPSNWNRESQLLFMADKQREFISKEFSRLKDFLMTALGGQTKICSGLTAGWW